MTATARPRFRTDLVAEPIDDGGLRFIDVLDPDSGNGFRFFEIEYSLACAMDGERDVAGLVRWAREELGVEPTANEVGTVITTLGELGYLEGLAAADAAVATDDELGLVPGVVAAPPAPFYAPEEVELGGAGTSGLGRPVEAMPVADDVELGIAGANAPAAAPPPPMFGADAELGPAGGPERVTEFDTPTPPPPAMPSATLRPVGGHAAEEDGPTNLPTPRTMDYEDDEVSVDLSDHLAISASDVKEAVRASKVMAAVDVPKDVLEQLEADEAQARDQAAAAQAAREQTAATEARAAEAREALAREAEATAAREAALRETEAARAAETAARDAAAREADAAREAAARQVKDLPQIPVGVSKKKPDKDVGKDAPKAAAITPVEQPAKPTGARRAVWLLLVLAIVIAGAYYVWTKVLKKPLPWEPQDEVAETAGPVQPVAPVQPGPPQPPPPPPAPPPVATLAEKPGDVSNMVAGQAGALSFVIADGSQVAVGDAVLRFAGNPADEKKLEGFEDDIERRYPKQIEEANKAKARFEKLKNAAQVKAQDAKIAEVTRKIESRIAERATLQAKLDGLTLKAPIAGVVKLAPRIGKAARTTADQSVASVTAPATLAATFTIPPGGKTYSLDASVRVAVKGTPDQKANCTVTNVDGSAVTVTCPGDAGIAAGTDLVLE